MLSKFKTYIIIKDFKELKKCQDNILCNHIVYESGNNIYIWDWIGGKWVKSIYSMYGKLKAKDIETTGFLAYQRFYRFCGKENIERMKKVLPLMDVWDSEEQMHMFNFEHAKEKIYQPIFELDVNSAFTYGAMQLPDDFNLLKEYLQGLYDKKESARNEEERSKYKNLQVYLIGYFARIKEFVSLRSEIIRLSNRHIKDNINEIIVKGGTVYLSNTDSIVTDIIGYKVIEPKIGTKVGQFKLSTFTDRLYYQSSNCYQLGDKVTYSGVKYFARKHTDFFEGLSATQEGSLIEGYDFDYETENEEERRVCRVRYGMITVTVYNELGEVKEIIEYKGVIK